jgi:tRNA wybutosine-synthesizing protein 3
VLSAGLQAGFRESGAINLIGAGKEPATPIVAVRSMGLALESIIGFHAEGKEVASASEEELKALLEISNERFVVNSQRIERFRELLKQLGEGGQGKKKGDGDGEEWEDAEVRRERKREAGLRRREMVKESGGRPLEDPDDFAGLEFLE